jgi:hypothetical protein
VVGQQTAIIGTIIIFQIYCMWKQRYAILFFPNGNIELIFPCLWLHELILINVKLIYILLLFILINRYISCFLYSYFSQHAESALCHWDPQWVELLLMKGNHWDSDCTMRDWLHTYDRIRDGETAKFFTTRQREFASIRMTYDLERMKWDASNVSHDH